MAQIAEEVRLPAHIRKELGVHLGVVEARHGSAIEAEGAGRDDEIAALEAAVAESSLLGERGIVRVHGAKVPLRRQARQELVELGVIGDDGRGGAFIVFSTFPSLRDGLSRALASTDFTKTTLIGQLLAQVGPNFARS